MSAEGWYVVVRSGQRRGLLAGPVDTKEAADELVPAARTVAEKVDPWAWAYDFGSARIVAKPGKPLPPARAHERVLAAAAA